VSNGEVSGSVARGTAVRRATAARRRGPDRREQDRGRRGVRHPVPAARPRGPWPGPAPGGTYRQVTGDAAGASVDLGLPGLPGIPVYQAFADVTGLVAQYGRGAWSATGWAGQRDDGGVSYLGWTLVVVTADGAAPSGQVMVLDGARPVDAADPGFSAPLGGLLAGQAVQVHVVAWTEHGPQASAFTQPLAGRPAVSFAAAAEPYLVGVITATDS
jgi:hypothetical protein